MNQIHVVVVNGSPNVPSRSGTLGNLALAELRETFDVQAEKVAPYAIGPGLTGAITRDDVDAAAETTLRSVEQADLLIVSVPVYRGAYPGMVKHFFDLVDQYALAAKPVLLMATGGSERHSLVIDQVLRPLFGFFQAWVAPTGVYVESAAFDGTEILDASVYTRERVAVNDLIPLLKLKISTVA
ncbi:NAD(P)H-dependent oxidoreductase [Changpingibacter yushuensis]|uniref:NAD(P)H-dependent oxidoreductase n=1 Tax=Changpingibacter yushuensis TaxID=2758440 RepID=UPI001C70FDCD|nr:NAD(P)H-dependent oxidoreductase [Changpingibacter yushuensis]